MDDWHQVSDCLDSGLMGALKIHGRSASVGTGKADAAQLIDFSEAGAPAEAEKAADAEAPAQVAGGRYCPLKLVVANRRRGPIRPKASAWDALGIGPRVWLIAKDGERVDHAASR